MGPAVDNLLTATFEAHNPERNHHRRYQLTVGRDLLDDWTVTITYGRTGQGGREQRYASPNAEDLRAILNDRLRRRLTAPRRIGCSYRLTAYTAASGFDGSTWLYAEIISAFRAVPRSNDPSTLP